MALKSTMGYKAMTRILRPYSEINPRGTMFSLEAMYPELFSKRRLIKGVSSFDAGQSDYLAEATANFTTGQQPYPTSTSRFLALFTTAPTSDAGTGGTEVSGGSYARVQIAGQLTANAAWTTSSTTITLNATAPAWLTALGTNGSGVNVFDNNTSILTNIGTVSSVSGTTVTLTASASHASNGSTDTLMFSAFPGASASSGTEPTVTPVNVTNGASITFPAATANWGTVVAFAIYDASSSGNMLMWDYIGNYNWLPFTCTSASPGVITVHAHGYNNNDSVVVTSKFGGTLPSTGGSWSGILTVANSSTDTFTAGVNTTSTGDGMVRKVIQQSIPSGVTASFAASTLTLNVA
jgi:hypothetical protein